MSKINTRFYLPEESANMVLEMQRSIPLFNKPVDVLNLAILKLYQEYYDGKITINTSNLQKKKTINNQPKPHALKSKSSKPTSTPLKSFAKVRALQKKMVESIDSDQVDRLLYE